MVKNSATGVNFPLVMFEVSLRKFVDLDGIVMGGSNDPSYKFSFLSVENYSLHKARNVDLFNNHFSRKNHQRYEADTFKHFSG